MTQNLERSPFWTDEEWTLTQSFLDQGYVIARTESPDTLERIRTHVAKAACGHLGLDIPADAGKFLDDIAAHVDPSTLNDLRLAVINALRSADWFRPAYLALARQSLQTLVGNELAMQRGIGLSVQLPQDDSSLLPIHADVWDGDSSFEVVQWVPLVDCFGTKTMYIVPPSEDRAVQKTMHKMHDQSAEDLYNAVAEKAVFLDLKFGDILLFSQTLMHGNRINVEDTTRWSMNCRFKSIMSPYAQKKLGEFFEPITIRGATRIGLDYSLPEDFDE
ncbi:MAG: hypothetical protein RH946_05405 [Rhodospirillales bacterium]